MRRRAGILVAVGVALTGVTGLGLRLRSSFPRKPPPAPTGKPQLTSSITQLPLGFELNQGQFDSRVLYAAHTSDGTLFFTKDGLTLALPHFAPEPVRSLNPRERLRKHPALQSVAALRLAFDGANSTPEVAATDQQPGIKNYLIGRDPEKWHTHVPIFGKVAYRNLYPGIDLVFYGGKSGVLEYDLNVSPGASPDQIRFRFEGADRVEIDDGDLLIHAGPVKLRQPRPHVFTATVPRREVPVSYRIDAKSWIGLDVSKGDARDGLRIDPVLAYSTYLGGSGEGDVANSMTIDLAGSVYVSGWATSIDFPTTDAGYEPTDPTHWIPQTGNGTSTVTKLDPSGSSLVFSTYVGGPLTSGGPYGDEAAQILVTDAGFTYFVGQTESPDFPVTNGVAQPTFGGGNLDGYVVELAPDGDRPIYSTFLGGPDVDLVYALDLDSDGNAYLGGTCFGANFPTSENAFQAAYGGNPLSNGIFAKLNPDGTHFLYKSYFGGSGSGNYPEGIENIQVDANQLLLAGWTASSDVPGHELSPLPFHDGGGGDIFVTKLVDDGGGQLSPMFFTYLGGSGVDYEWDLKVDRLGNIWMVGHTGSADFPVTPDAPQFRLNSPPTNNGAGPFDAFIAVLDPAGTVLHATFLGGNNDDRAIAVALDAEGHAHILGFTTSTDLPTTSLDPLHDEHDKSLPGYQEDAGGYFLADFTIDGGLDFLSYVGGVQSGFYSTTGEDIAVDSHGATYFVGSSASTDFPVTDHAFQAKNNAPPGVTNMVVVKITPTPLPATLISIQPTFGPYGGVGDVKVQGTNMSAQCELDFGGVPSVILVAGPDALQVNVEPHACGVVDVTLSCPGSPLFTLPDGFTFEGCPDAGPADAGPVPAGGPEHASSGSGCGCGSPTSPLDASWVLGLVLLTVVQRLRQRRAP